MLSDTVRGNLASQWYLKMGNTRNIAVGFDELGKSLSTKGAIRFLWISVVCALCAASKLLHIGGQYFELGWRQGEGGSSAFGGMRMESYHWFLLGVMVAFTPSLVVLGVMLARPIDQSADANSPESEPY